MGSYVPVCHFHYTTGASNVCLDHRITLCNDCLSSNDLCNDDCNISGIFGESELDSRKASAITFIDHINAKLQENGEHISKAEKNKEKVLQDARNKYDEYLKRLKDTAEKMFDDFEVEYARLSEAPLLEQKDILDNIQRAMSELTDELYSATETKAIFKRVENAVRVKSSEIGKMDFKQTKWEFNVDSEYGKASKRVFGFFFHNAIYEDFEIQKKGTNVEVAQNNAADTSNVPSKSKQKSTESKSRSPPPNPGAIVQQGQGRNDGCVDNGKTRPTASKTNGKETMSDDKEKVKNKKGFRFPWQRNNTANVGAEGTGGVAPKKVHAKENVKKSAKDAAGMSSIAPIPDGSFCVKVHADKRTPCSFDIVRVIPGKCLLVFDSAHKAILALHYDGRVIADLQTEQPFQHLLVMDNDSFATLSADTSSITCFKIGKGSIKKRESITIQERQRGVIGFDFDSSKQQFYILTPDMITVVSQQGTIVDVKDIVMYSTSAMPVKMGQLKGASIFEADVFVVINEENTSIKRISAASGAILWKRRLSNVTSSTFNVTVTRDRIFVLMSACVVVFSMDGDAIEKIDLTDGTDTARAFCIDETFKVVVVTSGTEENSASRTIHTIGYSEVVGDMGI